MSVPQMIMTDAGKQMLARAVAGEPLNFTRLAVGDGVLTAAGQIAGMTGLIHQVVSVTDLTKRRKGDTVSLRGELVMPANATSFRWRELGLFAQIGSGAEKMYAYINLYEDGEMVKPDDGVERTITASIAVGDAPNVTVTLDPLGAIAWERIEDPPEDYKPSEHTHDWEDIDGKPDSFTPSSHEHDAADINSGTLVSDRLPTVPISKGGTGKTTKDAGRKALGAVAPVGPTTVTLSATAWSGSGPWTQTVTVSGVTASDNHLHIYPVDIADEAARKLYDAAYGCLAVQAETVAGGIKFTCREKKPETNFQVVIEGGRV